MRPVRQVKFMTAPQAMQVQKKPDRMKLLWQRFVGEDLLQVRSKALNIISCPNARRGAKLAIEIATELALREDPVEKWHAFIHYGASAIFPGGTEKPQPRVSSQFSGERSCGPVLLLNSYAGPEFLAEMLNDALGVSEPEVRRIVDDASEPGESEDSNCISRAPDLGPRAPMPQAPITSKGIPLAIIQCETGTLVDNVPNVKRTIKNNDIKTLVLNSFEFACYTQREREKIATELRKLQQETEVTLIVITSYSRKGLEAGMMCPGAIGLLAAYAESISRVTVDFPSTLPSQKIKKQRENGTVHENETLAPSSPQRLPPEYQMDILPNERLETDEGFDENVNWSGEYLSKLAFTPLLKAWYAARPYDIFPPGGRPTEEGLMMVEAAKVEWARADAKYANA